MNFRLFFIIAASVFLFISCSGYSPEVENALKCAGNNRSELEKVLEHYSQHPEDSLQLRAAEFLIIHMPGHYSLNDRALKKHVVTNYSPLPKYLTNTLFFGQQDNNPSERAEDITTITADFLIRHIDLVFKRWQSMPWSREFSFDTFCEYILPYRIDCEPLEWAGIAGNDEDSVLFRELGRFMYHHNIRLREAANHLEYIKPKPPVELHAVYRKFAKALNDCHGNNYRELATNRHFMIPTYMDFTPHWSQRNGNHSWTGFSDTYANEKNELTDPFVTTTKIYRHTYSRNPVPGEDGKNHIPGFFRNPFCKDVTDLYFRTFDIRIPLAKSIPSRYAYLSVFSDLEWHPVSWGNVSGKTASFTKTGGGAVYLPVYYDGENERPAAYPFTVDGAGKVTGLQPDVNSPVRLHLTRKYPLNLQKLERLDLPVGLVIEGSNRKDMHNPDTLYVIRDAQYGPFYAHALEKAVTYRYYRISQSNSPVILLAELGFYDSNRQRLLPLSVITGGQEALLSAPENSEILQAMDGDYLSFARMTGAKEGFLFDFGTQAPSVSFFECMPQNDENFVYPGNIYELFYWGEEGWVSQEKKEATGYSVTFEDVPSGALYWLRNLTKGKEERVFTCENGQIRFW